MVTRVVVETEEYRGARFTRVDLSGAVFRDLDLTGARVIDALLIDADLSGVNHRARDQWRRTRSVRDPKALRAEGATR